MAQVDRATLGRLVLLIFGVVLSTAVATSARQQTAADVIPATSRLEAQLDAADRLAKERRWDEARPVLESVLAAARESANLRIEGRALAGLSEVFFQKALYPSAREYGLRALDLAERIGSAAGIGRASLLLSLTAGYMGDRSEARSRAERAVTAYEATDDRRGRASATLARLRSLPENSPEYPALMEQAIDRARASGDANLDGEAAHFHGDDLFNAGNYPLALSELERAAASYATTSNSEHLGAVYNSLGRVYRAHGQLQQALQYQLKALQLHEREKDSFYRMQSLNAVAAVYGMLGESDKARTYVEQALQVAERSGSPRIQDFLRANLATYLLDEGEYSRAVELLEGVIARGVDSYVNRRYTNLSYALARLGRMDEAMRAAETGVERCSAGGGDEDCTWALERRAYTHLARGESEAAISDLTVALNQIENARTRLLPSDFFKREFVHHREGLYSLTLGLQLQRGRGEEALETAELARSRAFIDLLASRDLRPKSADESSTTVAQTNRNPGAQIDPSVDPMSRLALTLRGARSGGDPALAAVPSSPPDLSSVKTAAPARATDLVAVAQRLESTLLVYWVAQDELYIWVVTPRGLVRTARVDVLTSKLAALVRATAPFPEDAGSPTTAPVVATRGGTQFSVRARPNAWRELYDLLIRPVLADLPSAPGSLLTIVPHGPLAGLSFAALQNERGRYLLEDHALHYAPAGAVLQFTGTKHHANARSGAVLVVADPELPRAPRPEPSLPPLAGARLEARAIARQFPRNRVTVLTGSDASKTRVTTAIERKAAVHFATHAIVRDDAPFDSFLALAADGATVNGRLTAQDVYQLNLDADLVVLSACRSAAGRVSGDGIAAFARAFIYAGTPSVIASVWDVSDEATSRLIAAFYRSWLAGTSKSRALRSAQLELLRDLRAGRVSITTSAGPIVLPEHPIFWAGFSLIGEPE